MIPKIIHYVWVGEAIETDLVKKCIASWKKYCPDYKIMCWNNESLKLIDNTYTQEAVKAKKWAFVSDYLRLYALDKFGGIYLDSDVEITNNIDKFLNNDFFTGYEDCKGTILPVTALMAAKKNNQIIKDLLSQYIDINFIVNGKMDMTTNSTRISKYFKENFNIKPPYNGDLEVRLTDKAVIYPSYYFCTPKGEEENYSIHHFNGSWKERYKRDDMLSFGKYSLISIKEIKENSKEKLPITDNENIIFTFKKSKKKSLLIIKRV